MSPFAAGAVGVKSVQTIGHFRSAIGWHLIARVRIHDAYDNADYDYDTTIVTGLDYTPSGTASIGVNHAAGALNERTASGFGNGIPKTAAGLFTTINSAPNSYRNWVMWSIQEAFPHARFATWNAYDLILPIILDNYNLDMRRIHYVGASRGTQYFDVNGPKYKDLWASGVLLDGNPCVGGSNTSRVNTRSRYAQSYKETVDAFNVDPVSYTTVRRYNVADASWTFDDGVSWWLPLCINIPLWVSNSGSDTSVVPPWCSDELFGAGGTWSQNGGSVLYTKVFGGPKSGQHGEAIDRAFDGTTVIGGKTAKQFVEDTIRPTPGVFVRGVRI